MRSQVKMQRCGARLVVLAMATVVAGCGSVESVNLAAQGTRLGKRDAKQVLAALGKWRQEGPVDYCLGPGDLLTVRVFELEEPNATADIPVRVSEAGVVTMPLVGQVRARGCSAQQLALNLGKLYKEFIIDPQVSVFVKEYRARTVAVVGAVETPGLYQLDRNQGSLLGVLAQAGGLQERAGRFIYVVKISGAAATEDTSKGGVEGEKAPEAIKDGETEKEALPGVIVVDSEQLLEAGDISYNIPVDHGDTIHVPEAGFVYVMGHVREPGGFRLRRQMTILQAVSMSGGLKPGADTRHVYLKRRADNEEKRLTVNLSKIARGRKPDMALTEGDVIEIRQTTISAIGSGLHETFKATFGFGYGLN